MRCAKESRLARQLPPLVDGFRSLASRRVCQPGLTLTTRRVTAIAVAHLYQQVPGRVQ
jgi:hypothetical protein